MSGPITNHIVLHALHNILVQVSTLPKYLADRYKAEYFGFWQLLVRDIAKEKAQIDASHHILIDNLGADVYFLNAALLRHHGVKTEDISDYSFMRLKFEAFHRCHLEELPGEAEVFMRIKQLINLWTHMMHQWKKMWPAKSQGDVRTLEAQDKSVEKWFDEQEPLP